uniref:Putative rwd domain protein n=1 Tax=Tabanus bromius TaxID=304241 RepID=A0A0K8TQD7_TABBR
MSEMKELQDEEREALISIYEGDTAFKQINATTFQYKYGEDDDNKSFLVEICWGQEYPSAVPTINMDTFYNRHLKASVKDKISAILKEEAEQWLGCGMTYTLFECLKERIQELIQDQPDEPIPIPTADVEANLDSLTISDSNSNALKKTAAKKEQLTKAQKRRQWERTDHKGERARGWDWVDIVKHLSQTGSKEDSQNAANSANVQSVPS